MSNDNPVKNNEGSVKAPFNHGQEQTSSLAQHYLLDIHQIEPGDVVLIPGHDNHGKFTPDLDYPAIVTMVLCPSDTQEQIAGLEVLPIVSGESGQKNTFKILHGHTKNVMGLGFGSYEIPLQGEAIFVPNKPESLGKAGEHSKLDVDVNEVKCLGSMAHDERAWGNFITYMRQQTARRNLITADQTVANVVPKNDANAFYGNSFTRKDLRDSGFNID